MGSSGTDAERGGGGGEEEEEEGRPGLPGLGKLEDLPTQKIAQLTLNKSLKLFKQFKSILGGSWYSQFFL